MGRGLMVGGCESAIWYWYCGRWKGIVIFWQHERLQIYVQVRDNWVYLLSSQYVFTPLLPLYPADV